MDDFWICIQQDVSVTHCTYTLDQISQVTSFLGAQKERAGNGLLDLIPRQLHKFPYFERYELTLVMIFILGLHQPEICPKLFLLFLLKLFLFV